MNLKDFQSRVNICFKSNDVRCIVGNELDSELAYRVGKALALFLKSKKLIVGRDMRSSSKKLNTDLIKGLTDQGANVIDIGMVDTPQLYFASGSLNLPGAMITASHNPAEYNGIKMVRPQARPIGEKTGINKIKEIITKDIYPKASKGKTTTKDLSASYKAHILSFINKNNLKKTQIVIDAGNGMAGKIVPLIYNSLPMKIKPLHFKITGSFPHHVANPIKHENIHDLEQKVKEEKAEFGMSFDSDMDRVVFVDT